MKKFITGLALFLAGAGMSQAQYYGSTLFVEGFDGDSFPSDWTQVNSSPGNQTVWTLSDGDKPQFSTIEKNSKRSAKIMVKGNDTMLTLTSPEIDATGKSNMQVGFYGYELTYAFRGGIDFRFRASHDGGQTWTDLFSATQGSSFNGTPVGIWNLYKYTLPSEFDGKKILLQFYVDASPVPNPQSLAGYVDGVFLSLVPECDPEVTAVNYSTNDRRPTTGVFGNAEPLTLTLRNAGTHELTEAEMYYSINGGDEVSEKFTFPSPLAMGQTLDFTFSKGIDLSAPRSTMTIRAGVRHEGDEDESNNELTAFAENLVVGVPYIPPFLSEEDGVTVSSTDEWTTFENNYEFGWDYDDWNDFYWYVETGWNDDPNDAYLVSRPITMVGGASYRLQFSASTEDVLDGANKMKVYVCTDPEMNENPMEIWSNDNITEENALNQSAVFTVPADGFYYLGFHSLSEPGAGMMRLDNIALYRNVDKDAALLAVESPAKSAYTYGTEEKLRVKIANYGSSPIAAGQLKATAVLDSETVAEETVGQEIPVNGTVDFEFATPIDLSDLGTLHKLNVTVTLDGDEDADNNSLSAELESDVTLIPYIPDFGTQSAKGGDVKRWYAEDTNGDGYDFTARSDAQLDSYVYSYGGGLYGFTTVTLPSSDDRLLSRHISMQGGKSYKLSYYTRIGVDGGELPLEISLRKAGEAGVIKSLGKTVINHSDYRENVLTFDVPDDGIYQLEFAVVDSKPIDYRIYLGKFRLSENFGKDLSVEEVILPTRYVSNIRNFPVGARVRNNGTEPVTGFSLTATSASIGEKSLAFGNVQLEPDSEYIIYFNEDFRFNGDAAEVLTVSVSADGDEYAGNDAAAVEISYIAPYTLPYNPPVEEAITHVGAFNLNRDNFRFVTDRTLGVGFLYFAPEDTEVNDYIATPAMTLAQGAAHRISFSYYVPDNDTADFDLFAYDAATDTKVPVISLTGASQNVMSRYIGFFEVPADGDYSICIQPRGTTASLFVNASISVEEATELPDIVMGNLLSHTSAAVLGENERVEVEFTSVADQGVQCVPFELEVDGKIYNSIFTKYTTRNDGDTYKIVFENVDLNEPKAHEVVCRAVVPMDKNPQDNEARFVITSLPIVDVALKQLVSPVSGKLSHAEKVTVSVENKGKGAVSDVELTCTVSSPAGSVQLSGKMTESVAAGETALFTFDKTVDMYDEGIYTFTLKAVAEGDVNDEDNTLTVSVNSTQKDFDAGVSALIAPGNAPFGDAESITVAVTNYGETELFEVPVTVQVSYGDEAKIQTLTGFVSAVSVGETVDFTLPGTVDMKKCGDYKVKAFTSVDKDVNADNDSFETTVRCLTQDVGVTAIISPVTGEDLGVCDVVVEVTNFGEADVENIPMQYQIGSMPQLAVMTGVLKAGEKREFTFPVPYEFTSYRKATVKASTALENDADPTNDAMEADVENKPSGLDSIRLSAGVWPNPTSGILNVSADTEMLRIELYGLNGALLQSEDAAGKMEMQLQISAPAGHYLLKVVGTDGREAVTRVIVK